MNDINLNDFRRGLKYLQKEASKAGKYQSIAQLTWIVPFSLYLSTQSKKYNGLCKAFWMSTLEQHGYDAFGRIEKCSNINDMCHTDEIYFFDWGNTPEGYDTWRSALIDNIRQITDLGTREPLGEITDKLKIKLNDKSNNPLR